MASRHPYEPVHVRVRAEVNGRLAERHGTDKRVIVIIGPPGSGKSTLLGTLAADGPRGRRRVPLDEADTWNAERLTAFIEDGQEGADYLLAATSIDPVSAALAPYLVGVWQLKPETVREANEVLHTALGQTMPNSLLKPMLEIAGDPAALIAVGNYVTDHGWDALSDALRNYGSAKAFARSLVIRVEPLVRTIPAYAADVPEGPDLLDIGPDAEALAALIAAKSMVPPLSIGVFGEWGSGKSFFMRRVESEVKRLGEHGEDAFCAKVVHVWFNAWHYAEGNLWASLVETLFDNLHGATGPDEHDPVEAARERLRKKLDAERRKLAGADADLQVAAAQAERVEIEAEERRTELTDQLAKAHERAGQDIWAQVEYDLQLRDDLDELRTELGLDKVAEGAQALREAAIETRHLLERGSRLFRRLPGADSTRPTLLWAAIGTAIAAALGFLLSQFHDQVAWVGTAVTEVTALLGAGVTWYRRQTKRANDLIAKAERARVRIEEAFNRSHEKVRRELAEIDAGVEIARLAYTAAEQRLLQARGHEAAVEKEIAELSGARLLARFIGERTDSGDYRKMLGTLGMVRRDFDQLTRYFGVASDPTVPRESDAVDRIVLYIDDLDRCPPERVVQVLEAVHLLLAFPLFVVVVGVDARWLTQSLQKQNPDQLAPGDATAADAWDYLEKIFQLGYWVPRLTNDGCAALLTGLAADVPDVGERDDEAPTSTPEPTMPAPAGPSPADHAARRAIALELTSTEHDLLEVVAPLVGRSPRAAKRFVNLYRVVKARVGAGPAEPGSDVEVAVASRMLLLALTSGLPRAAKTLVAELEHAPDGPIVLTLRRVAGSAELPAADHGTLMAFLGDAARVKGIEHLRVADLLAVRESVIRYAWPGLAARA